MPNEFYRAGVELALQRTDLVKQAGIVKSLFNVGKGFFGTPFKGYQTAVGTPVANLAKKHEKALADKAIGIFGKERGAHIGQAIKGLPETIYRSGASSAALGGVFGGVEGALTNPEDRAGGALRGAGKGALTWGAMGLAGGAAGGAVQGVTRSRLLSRPGATAAKVDKQLEQRWRDNLTGAFGKGKVKKHPLGAGGAALAAGGGTAALGADFYTQMKINDMLEGQPEPPEQPTQLEQLNQKMGADELQTDPTGFMPSMPTIPSVPRPLVGSITGGTAAGVAARAGIQALKAKKWFPRPPRGTLLSDVIPSIASASGALAGYRLGQKSQAALDAANNTVVPEEKLKQIDFDKLLRYYRKPAVEAPATP